MATVKSTHPPLSGTEVRTERGTLVRDMGFPIPLEAVALIVGFEERMDGGGPWLTAYQCPAQKGTDGWTFGFGETAGVHRGMTITVDESWKRLHSDIVARTARVKKLVAVELTTNELGALVSLVYNIGTSALQGSTLLKVLNKGDKSAAGAQFLRWNKATVNKKLIEMPGLTRRRAAEMALWLKPEAGEWESPQEQVVEGDQPLMTSSPTMIGSAGLGAVGVLSGAKDSAQPVADFLRWGRDLLADLLPIPAHWIGPGLIVVIAAFFAWRRWQQRQKGLA